MIGVVLLLDMFVVLLALISLYQSRLQYVERAKVQTENLCQALVHTMAGIMDTADVALFSVADEMERARPERAVATVAGYIERQRLRLPELDSIRVADEQGRVAFGTGTVPGIGTSIGDRDFFQSLRHNPRAELVISKPIFGRISRKWVIVAGRRINRPDGSFGGIAYAPIALDRIARVLASIDVGPHGAISLRDGYMSIIVRQPTDKPASRIGRRPVSAEFIRRLAAGDQKGTFYTYGNVDGIPRVFSFARVMKYPLYVTVGLAAQDYLAPWQRELHGISALVGIFLAVTALMARMVYLKWCRERESEIASRAAKSDLELRVAERTEELRRANDSLSVELAERERAEQSVRQSRNMLAQIIDSIPQSVFWKDRNSVYLGCNIVFARMAGRQRTTDLIGKNDYDLPWLPEESTAYRRDDREVMETKRPKYHIIEQQAQKDGSRIWLDTCKTPLCDDQGEVTGVLGIYQNITERKEIEDARDKALSLFQALLISSPTGIQVFDGESGDCLIVNDALVAMTGGNRPAMLGMNFRKLDSWRKPGIYELAEQVLSDGVSRNVQRCFTTTFGKQACFDMFLARCDVEGRPHLMTINLDIAEAKRLEEEKRLMEAQMLHVQKLESLGVLAGGIAHDFNNILMVVTGNAELALNRLPADAPARANLVQIEQAAKRAADLAGQMLAYSGKGLFVIKHIDLNKIVREMSQMIEVSISKKVLIRYHLAAELPAVVADATQLSQVILNLVINASEAIADSGEICITTASMSCDRAYLSDFWIDTDLAEGTYVVLEVADTGCGMSPEIIARIFDPFFTTKFTGRGLGMAAVLGIIRGHRGAIKVCSEPGKGTTFRVLLPAPDAPAERGARQELVDDPAVRGKGTVLLVDDEATIRDLGQEMLQLLGFTPLVAAGGREAVEIFRAHKDEIVCVLLDLTMPDLDGRQTLQQLRAIDPQLKAVVTSGYSEHEVSQRFGASKFISFLQKPYKLSSVSAKLQEMLG